jgi:tetratricopeptide (TPR) repeat protein
LRTRGMKRAGKESKAESSFPRTWQVCLLIVLAILLLYARTLFFGLTYLDDSLFVLERSHFLSRISNLIEAFKTDAFLGGGASSLYYRPLLTVSFILDAQVSGTSPFFYHATNLILHMTASCLLFLLLVAMRYKRLAASMMALIFALHPALTQAVAWIPGRNDSLMAVFVFAAWISLLRYDKDGSKRYLACHLLAFAAALFTKETAVVLLALCLYYFFFLSPRANRMAQLKYLAAGWTGIGIAWYWLREAVVAHGPKVPLPDLVQSFLQNLPASLQYVGKIIIPVHLSVQPIMADTPFVYGVLSALLLAGLVLISKNLRVRFVVLGGLWFLGFLLPSFGANPPDVQQVFYEHRSYLPAAGILIILLETTAIRRLGENRRLWLLCGAPVVVLLGVITFAHSASFKDRNAFQLNSLRTSPNNPEAHNGMGVTYLHQRQFDQAEAEFKRALALNPKHARVHNNLGLAYLNTGKLPEAEAEFKREMELYPMSEAPYYNLSLTYLKTGQASRAEPLLVQTLVLNPSHVDANRYLARVYLSQNRPQLAARHVQHLLDLGVKDLPPELLNTLASK